MNFLMGHSSLRGVGETEKTEKSLPVIDMSELTKKWSDWFEPSVLDCDRTIGSNIYETSLPSPPPKAHSKDDGNNTENDKKSIRYSDAPSIRLRSTGRPFSLQSIQSILSETMTPSTYLAKVIEGETVTRHYYNRDLESNINNNNNNLSPYDATNKKSTDLESIVLSTEFSEKSHETINIINGEVGVEKLPFIVQQVLPL
ncbi:10687_t:CDS:2 [Entrophospora sp. SA101]|nr:10687_t:CDS:2 [Entrophospora sp. SA101]